MTQSELKSVMEYESSTGEFFRLGEKVDCSVLTSDSKRPNYKYKRICINGKQYLAHRLAWLHETGKFPDSQIDHKDRDATNNIFSNLREATHAQNMQNKSKYSNNASGHKGVAWNKVQGKWFAYMNVGCKRKHLGTFDNKDEAIKARIKYESTKGI